MCLGGGEAGRGAAPVSPSVKWGRGGGQYIIDQKNVTYSFSEPLPPRKLLTAKTTLLILASRMSLSTLWMAQGIYDQQHHIYFHKGIPTAGSGRQQPETPNYRGVMCPSKMMSWFIRGSFSTVCEVLYRKIHKIFYLNCNQFLRGPGAMLAWYCPIFWTQFKYNLKSRE